MKKTITINKEYIKKKKKTATKVKKKTSENKVLKSLRGMKESTLRGAQSL